MEILRLEPKNFVNQDLGELCVVTCLSGIESGLLKILNYVFNNVLSGSFLWAVESLKQSFSPDYAVDDLLWLLPDGAYWESLIFFPLDALVARRAALQDANASHVIAVGASVHQWQLKVEAHLVDMLPRLLVIKCVDHKVKLLEELESKSFLLDSAQKSLHMYVWVLFLNLLLES